MTTFAVQIGTFVQRTGLRADIVLRKLAFDAYGALLAKSPVDTGRFRGNWRIGINTVQLGPVERTLPTGQDPEAAVKIGAAKWGDTITFVNNLPYAERLENGWSKQAPQGVLRLTFQELKANVASLVRQVGGV